MNIYVFMQKALHKSFKRLVMIRELKLLEHC